MSPKKIESQLVQLPKDEQKRKEVIRKCRAFVLNNGESWKDDEKKIQPTRR